MKPKHIINLINFCMSNTSFSFNGKFYKQNNGAPMGCNLSPIIAEALVSEIFETACKSFKIKPKFIRFYVDDSFIILNKNYVDEFLEFMNKIGNNYKSIKFTIEKEQNNVLPNLDLKVIKKIDKVETEVYRKITHSNRYLNFNSHHSLQNKRSVIRTLIHRAFTHTNNKTNLDSELKLLTEILKQNNYPIKIIKEIIHQENIKFEHPDLREKTDFELDRLITIPYYKGISEKIKQILKNYDINVVFKKGNTLNSILNSKKKPTFDKSNVVYNINCNDCEATYIGETKRKLINRIKEHKSAIKRFKPELSNIAEHALTNNHKINFETPIISYHERKTRARKFLEGFQIEKFKNSNKTLMNDQVNLKTNMPNTYISLFK